MNIFTLQKERKSQFQVTVAVKQVNEMGIHKNSKILTHNGINCTV